MADGHAATDGMKRAASAALRVRGEKPASQRGGTPVGLRRAAQIVNGEAMSLDTVKRVLRYLSRHLKDKQGGTWDDQGKGWQAWGLWGGDAAGPWAAAIIRQEDPAWWNQWRRMPRNKALAEALNISTKPAKEPE